MIEYSITIKDENRSYTHKDMTYNPFLMDKSNQLLSNQIEQLTKEFMINSLGNAQEAPSIMVKSKIKWQ